ncbi:MAG: radical SAM protein [Theionarchaea archaeon]|nr:radical SAM protein [Theionarchaea archaeon]
MGSRVSEYEKAISSIVERKYEDKRVFSVQWHITDHCNLACKHCYSSNNSIRDLPLNVLRAIFDKYLKAILKWGVEGYLSLTGGEAILRSDFFELLDFIHARWEEHPVFVVSLMSNGTLIDEERVSHLKEYLPMLSHVQISLDGVNEETHDFLRGEGSFSRSKKGFSLLREGGFTTALHYVVHKGNYRDAFNILELGDELKVIRVTLSRLVPEGGGKTLEMLAPSELRDLWDYLGSRCLDYYPKGVFLARGRCDLWHLPDIASALYSLKLNSQGNAFPALYRVGQRCPVGLNGLAVDTDGTVYPCRRLPISVGNIVQDTFFKIWYSSRLLWKFRHKEEYMKGKCRDCPFLTDTQLRTLCAGGSPCISYGNCGDCFEPDPQCWFDPYSEEQREEVEKWRKRILE